MQDLMRCNSKECPIKETCFRYMETPKEWWQVRVDLAAACNLKTGYNKWVCHTCIKNSVPVCEHLNDIMEGEDLSDSKHLRYFLNRPTSEFKPD